LPVEHRAIPTKVWHTWDEFMVSGAPTRPRLSTALQHDGLGHVPMHDHEQRSELVLVIAGRVSSAVGAGQPIAADPGDCYIMPPGVPHDQRCRGAWRTRCVLYDGGEDLLPIAPRLLPLADDQLARRWFCDLIEIAATGNAEVGDALLVALLTRLGAREHHVRHAEAMPAPLAAALAFLERHFDQALADEDVARAAGVSVSHCGALFRAHVGCGPLRHLQRLRLERAARALRNPYLPVSEVAKRCGYADLNYFTRHFRRHFGQPPGRWRRAARSADPGPAH
jgi:AraC-like DNA-binding protein/mannose-6-phosphate isomerase-like protein (cupin superfamily)